jgi:hypothetical protein
MQRSLHRRDMRGDRRTGHEQMHRDFGCSIEVFPTLFTITHPIANSSVFLPLTAAIGMTIGDAAPTD